ncbi:exported hypothetical protein [uncultured delta proteobacterium]|uniref:Lipoprotein n=1 Tax=uncultured delta proteobacterium TaxID=34034 RepID=A0A212JEN9_9DELT|nr:exported hypothetical protein [uncultured delta proteobacterium]
MKKVVLAFVLAFSAFAISACVHIAYGPSDNIADAQYVQSVQAVLDSKETITFMDKAYMLANTAKPGPAQTWGVFGTIVVTDNTLYFLFWNRNANAFDVLRKLPLTDMANIDHISSAWGPGDYIAIEDKDHRFDLYSCYTIPVTANVVEKNRELLDSLNAVKNTK